MPAGRPKKYTKSRTICIYLDDKDLNFLDDHRGKVTRGDYLTESMYALKDTVSQKIKESDEKMKQLSAENHELKRQLMFERSRHLQHKQIETKTETDNEMNKAEIFENALINLGKSYSRGRYIAAGSVRFYADRLGVSRETLKECVMVFVDEYQMDFNKLGELKAKIKLNGTEAEAPPKPPC